MLPKVWEANSESMFVQFHWVDLSGILRARTLPKSSCGNLISQGRPLRVGSGALMGLGLDVSRLPEWFRPGGWDCIIPDWASFRPMTRTTASVMCCVSEQDASHLDVNLSQPLLRCPRNTLQRVVEYAHAEFALSMLVGFELEFYLLRPEQIREAEDVQLPTYNCWSTASGIRGDLGACLEDCVARLFAAGLEVEQFHAETGAQQYEISLGPQPVVAAVDSMVQAREIIKQVAERHQLHATFSPRPFADLAPSGLHTHISINSERRTSLIEASDIVEEQSFLAGVLHRLELLCAFSMPIAESYKRLEHFNLGTWISWGTGNRDTPVRKIKTRHWEFRAIDSTCNAYLALAAYIAAGLLGVAEHQELVWQDCRDATGKMELSQLKQLGITCHMPPDWASTYLNTHTGETDQHMGLDRMLGEKIIPSYKAVKECEKDVYSRMTESDRRKLIVDNF